MKKIMFSDKNGLTQAVLDGRKTQTRRLASSFLPDAVRIGYARFEIANGRELRCWTKGNSCIKFNLPYKVGEVVAVAQSYKDAGVCFTQCDLRSKHNHIWGHTPNMKGWTNKMFVQAEVMPHQIRITDVRVERLQDISEEDAIAEGITYAGLTYEDYGEPMFIIEGCKQTFGSARDAYAWLIDKISGKGTWQSNPYVFVYDFELIK